MRLVCIAALLCTLGFGRHRCHPPQGDPDAGIDAPETTDAAPECDPADEETIHLLTDGPTMDEDGSFFMADDGSVYLSFISNRRGFMETYLTKTVGGADWDGVTWSDPVRVIETPQRENLLNFSTRTSDGRYHLTGRYGSFQTATTGQVTSLDLVEWTPPVEINPTAPFEFSAGAIQEHPVTGDYWMVFIIRDDNGLYDLYLQRSTNSGSSWQAPPVLLTESAEQDFIFSFRITDSGKFILVWHRYSASASSYFDASADIYLRTSEDGETWSPELLLTDNGGTPQMDALPWLHDGPDGDLWVTWLTTSVETPGQVFSVVAIPVFPTLDVDDVRRVPAPGYSVRSQRLADGRTILAWVADQGATQADYAYRILCDWDFPPVE